MDGTSYDGRSKMLDCKRTHENLSDALDGALPWWKRVLMRMHLGVCPMCRRTSHSLERAVDTVASLRDLPPPKLDE